MLDRNSLLSLVKAVLGNAGKEVEDAWRDAREEAQKFAIEGAKEVVLAALTLLVSLAMYRLCALYDKPIGWLVFLICEFALVRRLARILKVWPW